MYNFSGNKMYYIPDYMYSVFLTGKTKKGLKFRFEINTWGPYYVDNANTEKYDDYKNITNLMVGYEKGKRFEILLDIRNLFDKKYAAQYVKSDTTDDYYIYPAPPRTYMVRASYKF
ncbi:MAG: hypothetical protein DSY47_07470 [Hydrogenothermus sp.]|nr:MAG: hypothetical protein DSY47_07470 [Hydrogenothermus sp.]